jgi:hypothetical protein
MEAGSGGSLIAQQTAQKLDYTFYHRDIVRQIAQRAEIKKI